MASYMWSVPIQGLYRITDYEQKTKSVLKYQGYLFLPLIMLEDSANASCANALALINFGTPDST